MEFIKLLAMGSDKLVKGDENDADLGDDTTFLGVSYEPFEVEGI